MQMNDKILLVGWVGGGVFAVSALPKDGAINPRVVGHFAVFSVVCRDTETDF